MRFPFPSLALRRWAIFILFLANEAIGRRASPKDFVSTLVKEPNCGVTSLLGTIETKDAEDSSSLIHKREALSADLFWRY